MNYAIVQIDHLQCNSHMAEDLFTAHPDNVVAYYDHITILDTALTMRGAQHSAERNHKWLRQAGCIGGYDIEVWPKSKAKAAVFNLLVSLIIPPVRRVARSRDTGEHVVSDSEDVQEASKEWADPVAARTGPFGAASDIPCEVWGDDEFDSVNAAKTIRLIGRFRSRRSPAIPGVKPA